MPVHELFAWKQLVMWLISTSNIKFFSETKYLLCYLRKSLQVTQQNNVKQIPSEKRMLGA